jgi:HSP20 family protein
MDIKDFGQEGKENSSLTLFIKKMNRVFKDFSKGFALEPFGKRTGAAFEPKVNISESEKEVVVSAELPGIDGKDIDVSLSKDELTIQGEKREEKEEEKKSYYRMERLYGSFKRTLPLPCEVKDDKVEAQFKNGVLIITLPKEAEAIKEAKKITVKSE